MAQQLGMEQPQVRQLTWPNLAAILRETGTTDLLPGPFAATMAQVLGG